MQPGRRRAAQWVACLFLPGASGASAQQPSWSLEAQRRLLGGTGLDATADMAERLRLIESAERALAIGDVDSAGQAFERAAGMVHSQDVELGIVRTHMQAGQYRQALSFASHAAGAHPRAPAGTALYVWLLHIGGQTQAAQRYVQEGLQRHPGDPSLMAAQALMKSAQPAPAAAMMSTPLRAAPYAYGDAASSDAVFAGTAWLTAEVDGAALSASALVPAATLKGATRIWLRNGLGQTTQALLLPAAADSPTRQLCLAQPLPLPSGAPPRTATARLPFAGSPASTVEYAAAPGDADAPAWPVLRQGFFGHLPRDEGPRQLSMDWPAGPRGGPVFDGQGRLAGLAIAPSPGRVALLGTAGDKGTLSTSTDSSPATARGATLALDSLYEAGLRLALQVIVVR